MSILLNALNKAASDREAARLARARPPDGMPGKIDAGGAPDAGADAASPFVQPLAHRTPSDTDAPASASAAPANRGLWIALTLAVVSAVGFGYWMRGISSMRPLAVPIEAIPASAPEALSMAASGTIPAALRVNEAGPLLLRLDRHVETLGTHTSPR